jgi:hypothetical protein
MSAKSIFGTVILCALLTAGLAGAQEQPQINTTILPALDTAAYGYVERFLDESYVLTFAADHVDRQVVLSRPLTLAAGECGGDLTANYDPVQDLAMVCYELIDWILRHTPRGSARQQSEQAAWTVAWIALHELGHAVGNQVFPWPSPTATSADTVQFRRDQEARADQFATLTLLQVEPSASLAAAVYWILRSGGPRWASFWHGMAAAGLMVETGHDTGVNRYRDIVCLTYGSNPGRFSELGASLPAERSRGCREEYSNRAATWDRMLRSHRPPPQGRHAQPMSLLPGSWRPPIARTNDEEERPEVLTARSFNGRWRLEERIRVVDGERTCGRTGSFTFQRVVPHMAMRFQSFQPCWYPSRREDAEAARGHMPRIYQTPRTIFFWILPCVYSGRLNSNGTRFYGTVRCLDVWDEENPTYLTGTWSADRQ